MFAFFRMKPKIVKSMGAASGAAIFNHRFKKSRLQIATPGTLQMGAAICHRRLLRD
jgi:hypothetical protein